MKETIVQTALGITIIGAGRSRSKQITQSMALAPILVAADGGLKKALKPGLVPDAIIGDLDSISLGGASKVPTNIPKDRFHRVTEQDSTDFEKCLYSVQAPFVIAHGVTGNRLDHSLAALNALAKFKAVPIVVVSGKDLVFLCPLKFEIALPTGTRLSLFPLANVQGRASGLEHSLEGIMFDPLGRIGTSNRTIAAKIALEFDAPCMLVILPWRHLPVVVDAFSRTPD